jgi:hypothetical protein
MRTYVPKRHLVDGRVLDHEDQMSRQRTKQTVVCLWQIADEVSKLGDARVRVDEVHNGKEVHVELRREDARGELSEEALGGGKGEVASQSGCKELRARKERSGCEGDGSNLEHSANGVRIPHLALLEQIDVSLYSIERRRTR